MVNISMNGSMNNVTFNAAEPDHILQIYNGSEKLVTIHCDGSVEWVDGYQITEASEALAKSLYLSAEIAAEVKEGVIARETAIWEAILEKSNVTGSLTTEEIQAEMDSLRILRNMRDDDV